MEVTDDASVGEAEQDETATTMAEEATTIEMTALEEGAVAKLDALIDLAVRDTLSALFPWRQDR